MTNIIVLTPFVLLPCLTLCRVFCPGRDLYFCSSVPGCIHRVHKCITPFLTCQENPGKDVVYINGDVIKPWYCSHIRTGKQIPTLVEYDYIPIEGCSLPAKEMSCSASSSGLWLHEEFTDINKITKVSRNMQGRF